MLTQKQYKRIYNIEGFLDIPVNDMEDLLKLLPKKINWDDDLYLLHLTPYNVYYEICRITPYKEKPNIRFMTTVKDENYVDALIEMLELLSENHYI